MATKGAYRYWIVAAALIAVAIYAIFDPATSGFFPQCPLLKLTGFKCAGCGSQRVIHALLHGDVRAAMGYNAFLTVMLPVLGVALLGGAIRRKHPAINNFFTHPATIVVLLVLVIAWWVGRNLAGL